MGFHSVTHLGVEEGSRAVVQHYEGIDFEQILEDEMRNISPYLEGLARRLNDTEIDLGKLKTLFFLETHNRGCLIVSSSHLFLNAAQMRQLNGSIEEDQNPYFVNEWMGPPLAKHGFGFIRAQSKEGYFTIYPTLTLPNAITDILGSYDVNDFFSALNKIMDLINHDYAHQMTLPIFSSNISGIQSDDIQTQTQNHEDGRLIEAIVNNVSPDADPMLPFNNVTGAYERWAVDTHKYTLAHLFSDTTRTSEIQSKIRTAFRTLVELHDDIAQSDPMAASGVYHYFADVITFNLTRACGSKSSILDFAFECMQQNNIQGYHARAAKQTFLSVHNIKIRNGAFAKDTVVFNIASEGIGNMLIQLDPNRVHATMIEVYEKGILDIQPNELEALKRLEGQLEGELLESFFIEFELNDLPQFTDVLSESQRAFSCYFLKRFMSDLFFSDLDDLHVTDILLRLESARRDKYGYNYQDEFTSFNDHDNMPSITAVASSKKKIYMATQISKGMEDADRPEQVARMDKRIISVLQKNTTERSMALET